MKVTQEKADACKLLRNAGLENKKIAQMIGLGLSSVTLLQKNNWDIDLYQKNIREYVLSRKNRKDPKIADYFPEQHKTEDSIKVKSDNELLHEILIVLMEIKNNQIANRKGWF